MPSGSLQLNFIVLQNILCDFAFVMTQNRDYTIKIICIANTTGINTIENLVKYSMVEFDMYHKFT